MVIPHLAGSISQHPLPSSGSYVLFIPSLIFAELWGCCCRYSCPIQPFILSSLTDMNCYITCCPGLWMLPWPKLTAVLTCEYNCKYLESNLTTCLFSKTTVVSSLQVLESRAYDHPPKHLSPGMGFQPGLEYQICVVYCGASLKCNQKLAACLIAFMPLLCILPAFQFSPFSVLHWIRPWMSFLPQGPQSSFWHYGVQLAIRAESSCQFQLNFSMSCHHSVFSKRVVLPFRYSQQPAEMAIACFVWCFGAFLIGNSTCQSMNSLRKALRVHIDRRNVIIFFFDKWCL